MPPFHDAEKLWMWQADTAGIPRCRIPVKGEFAARRDMHFAFLKSADTELGTLQVGKDGDWTPDKPFDFTDSLMAFPMVFLGAMAEIEAENIHTGFKQRQDHFLA